MQIPVTLAKAIAQLCPASSINWSKEKAYTENNSSSIFWASFWLKALENYTLLN